MTLCFCAFQATCTNSDRTQSSHPPTHHPPPTHTSTHHNADTGCTQQDRQSSGSLRAKGRPGKWCLPEVNKVSKLLRVVDGRDDS